jgi:hypothetical protein
MVEERFIESEVFFMSPAASDDECVVRVLCVRCSSQNESEKFSLTLIESKDRLRLFNFHAYQKKNFKI